MKFGFVSQRLAYKLLLAIAIPLVIGLGFYALLLREQVEGRLIGDMVRDVLRAQVDELATELEQSWQRANAEAAAWARDPEVRGLLAAYANGSDQRVRELAGALEERLRLRLEERGVDAFAAVVHRSGRILAAVPGPRDDGRARAAERDLRRVNASWEPWFQMALDRPGALSSPTARERLRDGIARTGRRREALLEVATREARRFGPIWVAVTEVPSGGLSATWIEAISSDRGAPGLERWWSGQEAPPEGMVALLEELRERAQHLDPQERPARPTAPLEGTGWKVWFGLRTDAEGRCLAPVWVGPGLRGRDAAVPLGRSLMLESALVPGQGEDARLLAGHRWRRAGPLLAELDRRLAGSLGETQDLRDYGVSFSAPVHEGKVPGESALGVMLLTLSWAHVQEELLDGVAREFRALNDGERYASGYAFLFDSDANTIIGHLGDEEPARPGGFGPVRPNYGTRLVEDHGHVGFHEQLRDQPVGIALYDYPPGNPKTSAFRRTAGSDAGGPGWIVGVGLDDIDTLRSLRFLGKLLLGGAILLAVWSVLAIAFVSRQLTRPIRRLTLFTNKLAEGDLSARVPIQREDELGQLGRAFNAMAEVLGRANRRLVQAEKEAAWREMARQIAHEIKNPLTPLALSAQLLPRAWKEKPERFPEILERSVETILRSIESLRGIASDFSRFAGAPEPVPVRLALGEVIDECLDLYRDMAEDARVELIRSGEDGVVVADHGELRQVFVNLVGNALEALVGMGRATGRIEAEIRAEPSVLRVWIRDDGPGIPEEAKGRLFEPYFSTKTTGTGLGLAICRRVIQELGGELRVSEGESEGTTFEMTLPRSASDPPQKT